MGLTFVLTGRGEQREPRAGAAVVRRCSHGPCALHGITKSARRRKAFELTINLKTAKARRRLLDRQLTWLCSLQDPVHQRPGRGHRGVGYVYEVIVGCFAT